jgi:LysM repeat protein
MELTPAIAGALLVLAASFALSVGFVVANGGMNLPAAAINPSQEPAQGSSGPLPSGSPEATTVAGSAAPSTQPSVEASVEAETSPPSGTPTSTPSIPASPSPSSDRYALLSPCLDAPDCWIYVVRSGDNLVSIARYFGVPLAVVQDQNPWTETTQLVAGQLLRLPPPTR